MEALIISAGEPQLERCLESVKNQTVPFSNVVHISNVVPQHVAINEGISKITDEWLMKIDGDMVLKNNAVEIALDNISKNQDISMFSFPVYDDFFDCAVFGCKVYKTALLKMVGHRNHLKNDQIAEKRMRKGGFKGKKIGIVIATHSENPDEFQIFRRFYIYGVKYGNGCGPWRHTAKMFDNTGDEKYRFALKALEFGKEKAYYPGSHNIDFDRKMFEEFRGRDEV